MRIVTVIAASLSLAGCSSMSMDAFKPTPKTISLPVDSVPQGADAVSSLGPTCKTPCSLSLPEDVANFSIAFTLPRYQPLTVPVQVTHQPGDFTSPSITTFDPNPVVGELQAEAPPARKRPRKRRAAASSSAAAPAATPAHPAR